MSQCVMEFVVKLTEDRLVNGPKFKVNYRKTDVLRYKSGLKKPPAIYDHLGPGRFFEVSDISHDG